MSRQRTQLIDRLESSAQDYLWYLEQLGQAELHEPAGAGEWTIHQIAAHMRDTEQHAFLARTEKILKETHPNVLNFDQEAWTRDHYVPSEPLRKIKSEFRNARRKLVRLLRSASKADWDNWATHSEYGRISLDWIMEHNYSHTLDHTAQIGRMHEQVILRTLNS